MSTIQVGELPDQWKEQARSMRVLKWLTFLSLVLLASECVLAGFCTLLPNPLNLVCAGLDAWLIVLTVGGWCFGVVVYLYGVGDSYAWRQDNRRR